MSFHTLMFAEEVICSETGVDEAAGSRGGAQRLRWRFGVTEEEGGGQLWRPLKKKKTNNCSHSFGLFGIKMLSLFF